MLPQSVLITGTSRGMGLELVRQLSADPCPPKHIFATCRRPDEAQELQSLGQRHPSIKIIQFDVLEFDKYDKLVKQIETVVGDKGLNLLYNNAGISGRYTLEEVTADLMTDVFKTTTVAAVMMVKAFLPLLRKASQVGVDGPETKLTQMSLARAGVVTISSSLGSLQLFESHCKTPFYATRAAKAAMNMMTRALARDLETDGILVVSLDPGWVKTRLITGPEAEYTVEEGIGIIVQTLQKLDKTAHGYHVDSHGKTVPW